MYVYIYIYVHTHTYIYIYINLIIYLYNLIYIYVSIYIATPPKNVTVEHLEIMENILEILFDYLFGVAIRTILDERMNLPLSHRFLNSKAYGHIPFTNPLPSYTSYIYIYVIYIYMLYIYMLYIYMLYIYIHLHSNIAKSAIQENKERNDHIFPLVTLDFL